MNIVKLNPDSASETNKKLSLLTSFTSLPSLNEASSYDGQGFLRSSGNRRRRWFAVQIIVGGGGRYPLQLARCLQQQPQITHLLQTTTHPGIKLEVAALQETGERLPTYLWLVIWSQRSALFDTSKRPRIHNEVKTSLYGPIKTKRI